MQFSLIIVCKNFQKTIQTSFMEFLMGLLSNPCYTLAYSGAWPFWNIGTCFLGFCQKKSDCRTEWAEGWGTEELEIRNDDKALLCLIDWVVQDRWKVKKLGVGGQGLLKVPLTLLSLVKDTFYHLESISRDKAYTANIYRMVISNFISNPLST